jgi:hypothetical protein
MSLHPSAVLRINSFHSNKRYRANPVRSFTYRGLNRWQREASGLNKWNHMQSRRPPPLYRRFFGNDVMLSKGTNPEAYRWWMQHRYFLPSLPPADYEEPSPIGRAAWPEAWTESFAREVIAMTDAEIREFVLDRATQVIFAEAQSDGFELRRLDFEGRPTTELPERAVIEEYVLEEPSLRDRVLQRVLEDPLAIVANSAQRAEIRDVQNLVRFAIAFVNRCRIPQSALEPVAPAVQDFLATLPQQPLFGFAHALPQETRPELLVKWQAQFQHPWQFGHALYQPRSEENTRGNLAWLRAEADWHRREALAARVASGAAREEHLAKIAAAAAADTGG